MDVREKLLASLNEAVKAIGDTDVLPEITRPGLSKGDYTTNVALVLASKLGQSPRDIAEKIAASMKDAAYLRKVEVAGPGFLNFWIKEDLLFSSTPSGVSLQEKKMLVEYAHPNTHKEMHIGHLRTLITGEALSRLFKSQGAEVFRANYQGDIGPHVAKALFGIPLVLRDEGAELSDYEKTGVSNILRAAFLGRAYARGSKDYEEHKEEIDRINNLLYSKDSEIWPLYETTRRWSLDYYEEFYKRFYTKFDRLFFESEMVESGKKIVEENVGKVFREENGAIIFPGEEYGLHTRVFVTQAGNPTYEGKEMGNGFAEQKAFNFDEKIHVVGSEQAGYFQVVFKALELIDPEKFKDKQRHISMGMVTKVDGKMSSRTGDVIRVDWLIDQVKERIMAYAHEGRISGEDIDEVVEMVAIGAIKYSVLKVGTGQNVAFDLEKSVSLEGDSGPYLQYTFARTQSVLAKSNENSRNDSNPLLAKEELELMRFLYQFNEVVSDSARQYSPQILAEYMFEVAKLFNVFYQKHKIIGSDREQSRLNLTKMTGSVLKKGLDLLGIKAPERM